MSMKCQIMYLLGLRYISEEALWHLVIIFFEAITQSRRHRYIKRSLPLHKQYSSIRGRLRHFPPGSFLCQMMLLALMSKAVGHICPLKSEKAQFWVILDVPSPFGGSLLMGHGNKLPGVFSSRRGVKGGEQGGGFQERKGKEHWHRQVVSARAFQDQAGPSLKGLVRLFSCSLYGKTPEECRPFWVSMASGTELNWAEFTGSHLGYLSSLY